MNKRIDRAGQVQGRLTVIQYIGKQRWLCLCSCGHHHVASCSSLTGKKVNSCGCLRKELISSRMKTHSMSGTRTYESWNKMRARCNKPNTTQYKWYGARGIKVCERWGSFENFFEDMGERPPGTSIDRIDNNGDYEPANCKWSTQKEQCNNQRGAVRFQGRSIEEWSSELGIKYHTLTYRMRKHGTIFPTSAIIK